MPPCDADPRPSLPDRAAGRHATRWLSLWVLVVAIAYAGTVVRCKAPGLWARWVAADAGK